MLAWLRRRWLLLLLTAAFILVVIFRFGEIERLVATLLGGEWQWVLATILLQVVYYLLLGLLYKLAFAIVQVQSQLPQLIPVLFASIFVNNLAPTGGISGAALFIDDAARHGQSPARAAEGILLVWVAQNLALLPVLAFGLAYLAVEGVIPAYASVATAIFLLLVAALTGGLVIARRQAARLRSILEWLQQRGNRLARRLRRRDLFPPDWAETNARELSEAAEAVAAHPHRVGYALIVAFAHTLVNLASIYTAFLAFMYPAPIGAIAAGLSLAIVYAVLSVLPLDVGVVQGVMAVVYTSVGVPTPVALAVVIVFGGLNAWLPMAIGFILLREVKTFGGR